MSIVLTNSANSYISGFSPFGGFYPGYFAVGFWFKVGSLAANTGVYSVHNTQSGAEVCLDGTNAYIRVIDNVGFTTTTICSFTCAQAAGGWMYFLIRCNNYFNSTYLQVIDTNGAVLGAFGSTDLSTAASAVAASRHSLGAGAFSGVSSNNGCLGEFFTSNDDGLGMNFAVSTTNAIPDALLRTIAYRGPFSVPIIAANVVEYHSFRTNTINMPLPFNLFISSPDDYNNGLLVGAAVSYANGTNPPLPCGPQPPLAFDYIRPGHQQAAFSTRINDIAALAGPNVVILAATAFADSSPTIGVGTITQKQVLTANGITTASPVIAAGTMVTVVAVPASGLTDSPPVEGVPVMLQVHLLSGANLATAPPVEGVTPIGQKHVLSATALALSSPSIGTSSLTIVLSSVSDVDASPIIGVGTMTVPFYLNDRVRDFGLDILRTEADKILICSSPPNTYTDAATTYKLGESANPFTAPVAAADGRKISSGAITGGAVTAVGNAYRWAIVDTVNSRLLAHGDLTPHISTVSTSYNWAIDPIVIDQPRS